MIKLDDVYNTCVGILDIGGANFRDPFVVSHCGIVTKTGIMEVRGTVGDFTVSEGAVWVERTRLGELDNRLKAWEFAVGEARRLGCRVDPDMHWGKLVSKSEFLESTTVTVDDLLKDARAKLNEAQ